MNQQIRRALFALAAAAALLAGIFALGESGGVRAQITDGNVQPTASYTRVDAAGATLDGFYYAADRVNIVRVSLHPFDRRNGSTVTYQDFGSFQIFYESTARASLYSDASAVWVSPSGGALAQCAASGNSGARSRCWITKAEWQQLAGQVGAADTDVVQPINLGFKVSETVADANPKVRLNSQHDVRSAARQTGNPSNRWAQSVWERIQPHRISVLPLNAAGEPIPGDFVFSNAAGNLGANVQRVRLSIGGGGVPGFDPPTYATWGTQTNPGVWISVFDADTNQNPGPSQIDSLTNLSDDQEALVFFEQDGTTALCANSSTGGVTACYLGKARWQALAGQTGAADTEPIKPIEIFFKVPAQTQAGAAWTGTKAGLFTNRWNALDAEGTALSPANQITNTVFERLIAHVYRYQSGSEAPGGTRAKLAPGTALPMLHEHSAVPCRTGDTDTDCTRDLELGEYAYIPSAIRAGGTASANGLFNESGSPLEWAPEHFDTIRLSYAPADSTPGDAIVVHSRLCPVNVPAAPDHPFVDSTRDRTATALRVCNYRFRDYYGDIYRYVGNPNGLNFGNIATGTAVIGTKTGNGTVSVEYLRDGILVAEDSFALTIAAATPGRLTSAATDPMITADLGQRTGDGSLSLLIGYQRGTGIPYRWGWTSASGLGGPGYVGPARYENVTSVALTVPAGGGTLEVLGTSRSCTAETASCTITLDAAALKQAARYGYIHPEGTLMAVIADTDPIWPPALRFRHAAATDVTITGVLTNADSTTHDFSYTAKAAAAGSLTVRAYFRGDADGVLEAGQSANIAVGYEIPADEEPAANAGAFPGELGTGVYGYDVPFVAASDMASEVLGDLEDAAGKTLHVLSQRRSAWQWQSYSAGGTDFSVGVGDVLWLGSAPPPLTHRYSPVPAQWGVDSYVRTAGQTVRTSELDIPQPADMTGAYLEISGPAAWVGTGGKRLALEGSAYDHFTCADSSTLDSSLTGRTCFVTDARGRGPELAVDAGASGRIRIIANLPAWQMIGAAPPVRIATAGVRVGFSRPRNTHAARRLSVFGADAVEVRSVGPVASAALARAGGATGAVRTGDPARLELAILDENGNAARAASLSSITLTTTAGKLRAGTAQGGSQLCGGGTTCVIPVRDSDSDDGNDLVSASVDNGRLLAKIFVDLYDVKAAGTATVAGTVVAAASSGDPVYRAEPLTVVFSGTAARLSLSEKLQRVNAYGTPDAAVAADPDADPPVAAVAKDDRDLIKIAVTAADRLAQTAGIPVQTTIKVTGPDGAAVPAGALSASIPEDECNTGRTSCNIVIDVNAARATPLASGIYTVELESGSLTAAETTFGVAGDPAAISFETADPGSIGTQFASVITVTDADGEPVADGTEVAVTVESRGRRIAVPVSRISAATQRTVNGSITARFVVIGREVATIKAEAGAVTRLAVVDTRTAPSSEEASPADGLGTAQSDTYTTWTGAGTTTASRLLADHADADRVFLWNGVRWLLYAEADGVPVPGSLDFAIETSDVLWLGAVE